MFFRSLRRTFLAAAVPVRAFGGMCVCAPDLFEILAEAGPRRRSRSMFVVVASPLRIRRWRRTRQVLGCAPPGLLGGGRGAEPPAGYFLPGFFLPATVRLGPLRVRALVRVRWPRTGSP